MSPLRMLLDRVVPPTGRHRYVPGPERVEVSLDDLLGPPLPYTTPVLLDVPTCGVLTQAWRLCSGPCDGEMPSVLHPDGSWTCGHCFATTRSGEK